MSNLITFVHLVTLVISLDVGREPPHGQFAYRPWWLWGTEIEFLDAFTEDNQRQHEITELTSWRDVSRMHIEKTLRFNDNLACPVGTTTNPTASSTSWPGRISRGGIGLILVGIISRGNGWIEVPHVF